MQLSKFADLWKGIFFLVSSVSLIIVVMMFIFIWQPLWTAGFNDFHTVSTAIEKLDKTAKPASEVVPLMLVQMTEMNKAIKDMRTTMQAIQKIQKTMVEMSDSMKTLEALNPNIVKMTASMDQMTHHISGQMSQMTYEVDQMEDKMSPMGMMPFNW